MNSSPKPSRATSPPASIAQSFWFWLHVFAVFCLAVLIVRGDKIVQLRTQRARNSEMRSRVAQSASAAEHRGAATLDQLSNAERNQLLVAFGFFGLVALGAWWQVWRTVLQPRLAAARLERAQRSRSHD